MVSSIGSNYGVVSSIIATNEFVERTAYTIYESSQNMVKHAQEVKGSGFLERQVMAQAGIGGLLDVLG